MTRDILDAAWQDFFSDHLSTGGAIAECQGLVDMERTLVLRAIDAELRSPPMYSQKSRAAAVIRKLSDGSL